MEELSESSTVIFPQSFTDSILPNAFHDSPNRLQSAKCHPGTQGYGIQAITTWLQSTNTTNTQGILWIQGPIGSGKTTLLQTAAEVLLPPESEFDNEEEQEQETKVVVDTETPPIYQYAECNDLGIHYGGTSFFFNNNVEDNSIPSHSGDKLFPTLAYGLAQRLPPLAPFIISAFDNDPTIIQSSFQNQFETLIFNPLQAWVSSEDGDIDLDLLLIIDGLDICSSEETQVDIIKVIRGSYLKYIPGIRSYWIIGSRDEAWTRSAFLSTLEIDESSSHIQPTPLSLSTNVQQIILPFPTDSEILSYFTTEFLNIRTTHPYFQSNIEVQTREWPTSTDLKTLQTLSDNLYLTAYSIINYISKSNDPIQRLSQLIESDSLSSYSNFPSSSSSSSDDDPFNYLNITYLNFLNKIPIPLCSITKRILGAITCTQSSSQDIHSPRICELAEILGLSINEFNEAIRFLYPIISVDINSNSSSSFSSSFTSSLARIKIKAGEKTRGIKAPHHHHHHHHPYIKGFQHRSFEQFLKNKSRSGEWCLNLELVHLDLARGCLRVFEKGQNTTQTQTQKSKEKGKGKGKEKEKGEGDKNVEVEDEVEKVKWRNEQFIGKVGLVIEDRRSSCDISTKKLAEERWFIHCWRTGSGKGSGSGLRGNGNGDGEEEQSEASLALLNDLWGFDYSLLPKGTIVDRYFVEWLMDIQEETIPEDQLLKTGGPMISLELYEFFRSRTTNTTNLTSSPNPSDHLEEEGDDNNNYNNDLNNVHNINNYLPPQYQRQFQDSNTNINSSKTELKLPPRLSYVIGSEPRKQMILVPMYDGKDCLREDLGMVKGPKDKNWDCIRCFWVIEKGDSTVSGVEVLS